MEILFRSKMEIGMFELKRDVVFNKIPSEMYDELINFGWQTGEDAAYEYSQKTGTSVPSKMTDKLNINVKNEDWQKGKSNVKVYSEYEDKPNLITLHPNVISEAIEKAKSNGFNQIQNYDAAKEIFLGHEIFHYLECKKIGLTSKKRIVTTLKLGPIKITSGIRALCEIAAHSFTKTLYYMNNGYSDLQNKESDKYDG